jgi:hypothetical protein
MLTSTTFAPVPAIGSGTFTATASTALLRIEVTYGGGTNSAKEAQIDEVVLTKV